MSVVFEIGFQTFQTSESVTTSNNECQNEMIFHVALLAWKQISSVVFIYVIFRWSNFMGLN